MGTVGVSSRVLYFTAPRQVEVRREELPPPAAGQVLVRSLCSAISAGTELLFYAGHFPQDLALDENIAALSAPAAYPLRYGYSLVGEVIALGPGVAESWLGRRVFAFQPHQSYFCAPLEALQPLPEGLAVEDAIFLPNMETAVNLVLDGAPLLGERALVLGQGIVGLLATALLLRFPLAGLVTVDRYPLRRQAGLDLGVQASLAPEELSTALAHLAADHAGVYSAWGEPKADLSFELSGVLDGLNLAIRHTGFDGRVVVGSWYGDKPGQLDLGGYFHRSRIRLISSQVSTLAPALSGRWSKERRFATAWQMLRSLRPSRWISQRFELEQAAQAYALLEQKPEETLQVALVYQT